MIGVISPSSPPRDARRIMRGVSSLMGEGYRIRLGWSVGARDGYLAGSDALRASDIMAMFEDTRVRALFCTRGGYGAARLLSKLDYEYIRVHPRILVGFSDITALSLALYAHAGLVTFAGPMVAAEFAAGLEGMAADALWDMLQSRRKRRVLPHCKGMGVLREGRAEGVLLGGNLAVLCSLAGTPWLPDFRDAILFLEDVGESVYRLDRMLLQLRDAGILGKVAGVALGSFTDIPEDAFNRELSTVLKEYLLPLDVPVLTDIPFGHIAKKITLPFGCRVGIDTAHKAITVLQPTVR
jgi:muramoyltetrapeptide carboxypeptidase